jgi:hypothetical protein
VEERGDDGVSEVWMSASDVSARWGRGWRREGDLQPCTSGKIDIMLKNKPGSARVKYALNVPRTPMRRNAA